jgi:putative CocE/NonD family hydrolase
MFSFLTALLALSLAGGGDVAYRLQDVMIPMRDGVRLHTKVFAPVDVSDPVPILMQRTPYGTEGTVVGGLLGPSPRFDRAGYVFVHQDVRGQHGSEGEWRILFPPRDPDDPEATDERTDTWDTIEWLLANVTGHNGRVGMWGISYPAWQVAMAMSEAHPALVAVSPQASPNDMFLGDDIHHNGAFRLTYTFGWVAFMAAERGEVDRQEVLPLLGRDAYALFRGAGSAAAIGERFFGGGVPAWNESMAHPDRDEYWSRRTVGELFDDVRPAALHVAGWFDAEDFRGPLDLYALSERDDHEDHNVLVVGPWQHGGWSGQGPQDGSTLGELSFGEPTATWFQEVVEFPFFEHHLRGGDDPNLPEVFAFETGGNVWHELDAWPPRGTTTHPLHLRADGILSIEPPADGEGFTAFESDPADPVPYSAHMPVFPGPLYMVEDQRFLDTRDDVLTFVTEPLEQDLVLAGAPEVTLEVSTTGTDADWVVKLIDVWPEDEPDRAVAGDWTIVTGDIFRARYRHDFATPTPLEPEAVTEIRFPLPDRLHRFGVGHCIAVQVHGSWFPLYDVNPQTYVDVYHAEPEDYRSATQRVFHGAQGRSVVALPVLAE